MTKVVLLRHGESLWNLENRFTGWANVPLSERGVGEAQQAGNLLKSNGYAFDVAFTSVLKRANHTLWIVLDAMDQMPIAVHKSWQLNERHYGALQGLSKAQMEQRYGPQQVHLWRRGFAVRPPGLEETDPRHPRFDQSYVRIDRSQLPATESLEDTMGRVMAYWNCAITPYLREGRQVLVVAHGNSLRALVKHLDAVSDNDIAQLSIPTGVPLVYEFDDDLNAVRHYYLAGSSSIQPSRERIAQRQVV